MENASQSFQKYLRAMKVLTPICDLRQFGKYNFANWRKRGCQSPKRIRGARSVCQAGCAEMISCIREKSLSGSFWTLTSTLNLTCLFSGFGRKFEPDLTRKKSGEELTFISNSTVSAKVGMACLGSLMVRTCCIPESPYQVRSLIRPAGGASDLDFPRKIAGANVPVEFVVLSRAKHISVGFMTTHQTKELRTWIMEHDDNAVR
jgi:hypothetical protein